jgi:hypothetical protein
MVPASYIRNFSVSADGRVGTYATWAVTNNIARVAFDAVSGVVQGPAQSVTEGPHDFSTRDVSPDGQQLVVITSGRQREDLYVMGSDGSGMRQLTSGAGKDRVPRWAPDGRQILFYSDRNGTFASWSVDRDGGGLRQFPNMTNRTYPLLSRDGSHLAAIDSEARIYLYDPKDLSKAPDLLPPLPDALRGTGVSGLFLWDWSPDSRSLAGSTAIGAFVYSLDSHSHSRIGGAASPTDAADTQSSSWAGCQMDAGSYFQDAVVCFSPIAWWARRVRYLRSPEKRWDRRACRATVRSYISSIAVPAVTSGW